MEFNMLIISSVFKILMQMTSNIFTQKQCIFWHPWYYSAQTCIPLRSISYFYFSFLLSKLQLEYFWVIRNVEC